MSQKAKESKDLDFCAELIGSEAEIYLQNNHMVAGRVVDCRPYWMKIDSNGKAVYINKAFVVAVKQR